MLLHSATSDLSPGELRKHVIGVVSAPSCSVLPSNYLGKSLSGLYNSSPHHSFFLRLLWFNISVFALSSMFYLVAKL